MSLRGLLCLSAVAALVSSANAEEKPLKVFLLVGQSNMQGHAHVRTLQHVAMDPRTKPLVDKIQDDQGNPRVCDEVWISYLSSRGEKSGRLTTGFGADENKLGPELTFGITMQEALDEPILIIKTAWGGKSLHTDFRPPSAGPYELSETQIEQLKSRGEDVSAAKADKVKATGHYFRQSIDYIKKVLDNIDDVYPDYDPETGYELAGFVWFQGWNDMVDRGVYPNRDQRGGYDAYSKVMADFIRDVRKELSAPSLPFVIGVMGVGGPVDRYPPAKQRYAGIHQGFRDAMAAPAELPEFKNNVAAVLTEKYWDTELAGLRKSELEVNAKWKRMRSEKNLNREQLDAAKNELLAQEFSDRELDILRSGISNQEYHYLGSGKIMFQIGKGFAEAMIALMDGPK